MAGIPGPCGRGDPLRPSAPIARPSAFPPKGDRGRPPGVGTAATPSGISPIHTQGADGGGVVPGRPPPPRSVTPSGLVREPPEPFSTSRLWKKRPSVPAQGRRARPDVAREGMGGGGASGRHTPIAGAKHAHIAHFLRIAIAHKIDKRKQVKPFCRFNLLFCLERVTGIEPASSAWKAEVLPLNHTRMRWSGRLDCATKLRHAPVAVVEYRRATSFRQA